MDSNGVLLPVCTCRMSSSWSASSGLPCTCRTCAISCVMVAFLLGTQVRHSGALTLEVRSIYHNASRFLPRRCDEFCSSQVRVERLFPKAHASINISNGSHKQQHSDAQLDHTAHVDVASSGYHLRRYYVTLTVGGQPLDLLLDTGSFLSWTQGEPCEDCYPEARRIYDPRESSQSQILTRGDPFCDSLRRTYLRRRVIRKCCAFRIEYGDTSWAKGCAVKDALTFRDADSGGTTIAAIGFGSSHRSRVYSASTTCGIMGLAHDLQGLSLPQQLASAQLGPSFSYCLPPPDGGSKGFLNFGSGSIPEDVTFNTTPFVRGVNPHLNYVHVTSIMIDGKALVDIQDVFGYNPNTGEGATLIDTGSTFSRVHRDAYVPFRTAWREALADIGLEYFWDGRWGLDTCYSYPNDMILPTLTFLFPNYQRLEPLNHGNAFVYTEKNEEKNERIMCWPFKQKQVIDGKALLIGSFALQSIQMIHDFDGNKRQIHDFDDNKGQLGWMYDKC